MWKQRALREGCVEVLAIRRWSAAGSHRRDARRRTGRRGRRTGTRDTGLRRWRVSRRVQIAQAHGACKPCAPGRWCMSGRRAGQYAEWVAWLGYVAGVVAYRIASVGHFVGHCRFLTWRFDSIIPQGLRSFALASSSRSWLKGSTPLVWRGARTTIDTI